MSSSLGQQDYIAALSEESKRLQREHSGVQERIRGTSAQHKPHVRRDLPRKRSYEDEPLSDVVKRPKLMSTIAVVVTNSNESQAQPQSDSIRERGPESGEGGGRVQEAYQKPDTQQRNRRMMGALMGHLNIAKRNLERDTSIEVKVCIESRAAEKNKAESDRIAALRRVAAQEQRQTVVALIEERVRQDEEKITALDKEFQDRVDFRSKKNNASEGNVKEADEDVDEVDGLDETEERKENSDDEQERTEIQNDVETF